MNGCVCSIHDHFCSVTGTILVHNRDLLFGMRIRNTVRSLGYNVVFVSSTTDFVSRLSDDQPIVLGIIDISAGVDWDLIRDAIISSAPVLAFGPHRDVAGLRAAKQAGVRRVVSNGEFHRDLASLITRCARADPGMGG